jgi:cyanophycinase
MPGNVQAARAGGDGPSGTAVVIGGAEDKAGRRDLLSRFVRLAGPNPRIALVPTASALGDEIIELYDSVFRKLGAAEVISLRPHTRAEALDERLANQLLDADAVFMTGGNQMTLAQVCVGTPFGDAIGALFHRGGVVAGTSAGASIVSEHMIAFGRGGGTPRHRMSQLARGLGLLPGMIIDQHFRERDRLGRLLSHVAQSPSLLGVGLDEDTAAIVRENVLEVAGRGAVTIVDGTQMETNSAEAKASRPLLATGVIMHVLPAGSSFDLDKRSLIAYDDAPSTRRTEHPNTRASTRARAPRQARRDDADTRLAEEATRWPT